MAAAPNQQEEAHARRAAAQPPDGAHSNALLPAVAHSAFKSSSKNAPPSACGTLHQVQHD